MTAFLMEADEADRRGRKALRVFTVPTTFVVNCRATIRDRRRKN